MAKEGREDIIEWLAELQRDEYHSELQPFESYKERYKEIARDSMNQFENSFSSGYQSLVNELDRLWKSGKPEDLASEDPSAYSLDFDVDKLLAVIKQKPENAESLSPREALQLKDEVMNDFFFAALSLYENQDLEGAVNGFLFLANIDPWIPTYWLASAEVLIVLGRTVEAWQTYMVAIMIAPTDIEVYATAAHFAFESGESQYIVQLQDIVREVVSSISDEADRKAIEEVTGL